MKSTLHLVGAIFAAFATKRTTCGRATAQYYRPLLEVLESRTVLAPFTWKGTVSNNWFDAFNWEDSEGKPSFPHETDDVTIPALSTKYPIIKDRTAQVNSVTADGSLRIESTLVVSEDLTNHSVMMMSEGSRLVIGGKLASDGPLLNLANGVSIDARTATITSARPVPATMIVRGTVTIVGDVINDGIIRYAAGPNNRPNELRVGKLTDPFYNYTQTARGELRVRVYETNFGIDKLTVTRKATLAGKLVVTQAGNDPPDRGSYAPVSYATRTGELTGDPFTIGSYTLVFRVRNPPFGNNSLCFGHDNHNSPAAT